ncbi:MAG: response regulator transcription factor [Thermoflexales bacterium]|nr:response regulator transcription factor [Thermoflexales bacterium]MDW8352358.1 response regulator transcription factor [Anaerolineae bacterium]
MKTAATKILLVQGGLGDSVGPVLERHGYRVVWVSTAKSALEHVASEKLALVVIDAPSLSANAEKLCQEIKRLKELPVLMIGADASAGGVTASTYKGCADAFISRPLQLRRLLSRLEKLLPAGLTLELRCGELVFRPADGILRKRNEEIYLNPKLSKLLQLFMQRQGEVLPRKLLMQQVWETDYLGDTRTLDVHIRWLREAIEDNPTEPAYLRTVRGQGYRFDNPKAKK